MRKVDPASGGPDNRHHPHEPKMKRPKNVSVPTLDIHASNAIAKAHTWGAKAVGRVISHDLFKRLFSH